jgi:hypothetical protein
MRPYPRPVPQSSSPGGPRHRRKGNRCERELIQRHHAIGVHAERYPLSGASRFLGVVTTSTSMRSAVTRRRWFLRRNGGDPIICLPWRTWAQLLQWVRP